MISQFVYGQPVETCAVVKEVPVRDHEELRRFFDIPAKAFFAGVQSPPFPDLKRRRPAHFGQTPCQFCVCIVLYG